MTLSPNVLVVDDDTDSLYLVSQMLSREGFKVVSADNGQAALDLLAKDRPDVVLLDIMMPGMNGLQVLKSLRESSRHYALPVIMLTACTNDEDVMSAYRIGSDYYIPKPFTCQQLRYGIELVLGPQPRDGGGQSRADARTE